MQRLAVIKVNEGSQGEKYGLKKGHVLLKYNEVELVSDSALTLAASMASGSTFKLLYADKKGIHELNIPLGRLGIDVLEFNFDPENHFKEEIKNESIEKVVVTTTHSIEGYRIEKYCDIVSAEVVLGVGLFNEMFASFTDTFGGRSGKYQSQLLDGKNKCMNELKFRAVDAGANAVIGVDLDYSEISGQGKSMLLVVATGTAVQIEPA